MEKHSQTSTSEDPELVPVRKILVQRHQKAEKTVEKQLPLPADQLRPPTVWTPWQIFASDHVGVWGNYAAFVEINEEGTPTISTFDSYYRSLK